jgi:hypothetical protein
MMRFLWPSPGSCSEASETRELLNLLPVSVNVCDSLFRNKISKCELIDDNLKNQGINAKM